MSGKVFSFSSSSSYSLSKSSNSFSFPRRPSMKISPVIGLNKALILLFAFCAASKLASSCMFATNVLTLPGNSSFASVGFLSALASSFGPRPSADESEWPRACPPAAVTDTSTAFVIRPYALGITHGFGFRRALACPSYGLSSFTPCVGSSSVEISIAVISNSG